MIVFLTRCMNKMAAGSCNSVVQNMQCFRYKRGLLCDKHAQCEKIVVVVVLVFYGPSTHLSSFDRARNDLKCVEGP